MMITEEMIAEDEKRWHDRNIVAELGYCGKHIRHRKNITNDDIRFYAYIMRKAYYLLKEQEPIKPEMFDVGDGWIDCYCGNCKRELLSFNKSLNIKLPKYCNHCGQAVKWNE